ncbi:MAG: NCS2 family permease, partial [Spirochaetales bacterium]|nr:NCS2 family permease [Spirochaetales bacterium]
MERYFQLKAHGTNVRTEVVAGVTTFLTMAYILIVQPLTLQNAGMDFGGVFTATAIASMIATLVMALVARLPFALAPGMGLNAFFAFSVVIGMGKSWQFALTAVFIEGIIFILLTI